MNDRQKAIFEPHRVPIEKDTRFEKGTRKAIEMKQQRRRGRISFYFDGSGNCSEVEVVEKE